MRNHKDARKRRVLGVLSATFLLASAAGVRGARAGADRAGRRLGAAVSADTDGRQVGRPRLQDSTMQWPAEPQRLPEDAPNILIVLLDDVGFGVSETFGGEVHTPTLARLARKASPTTGSTPPRSARRRAPRC